MQTAVMLMLKAMWLGPKAVEACLGHFCSVLIISNKITIASAIFYVKY